LASALLILLLAFGPNAISTPNVKAATGCTISGESDPDWGETIEQRTLDSSNPFGNRDMEVGEFEEAQFARSDSGELRPLTKGFHTAVVVANDSATSIRMNLTTGYRYTFCIQLHPDAASGFSEAPLGDAYLMQSTDWDRYRQMDYSLRHSDEREELDAIPPEWKSTIMWIPYRDVHAYESMTQTQFSVSLDNSGPTWTLLGGSSYPESYYLVFDGWDNSRDSDVKAAGRNHTVELTVMVEERISLPNVSAYLICCSLPLAIAAAPFLMHLRHQKGDKAGKQTMELMPMLDSAAGDTTPRDMVSEREPGLTEGAADLPKEMPTPETVIVESAPNDDSS